MNILEEIVAHKKQEVEERKSLYPEKLLKQSIYYNSPAVSLKRYLTRPDKTGIIAEIKRKSPSKGSINPYVSVERTSIGYMMAGASALSILTDKKFFGGSNEDLATARKFNFCPILRKEFIIDPYQVIEAKSIGADAILLIAAILDAKQVASLTDQAHSLGLEVLLEIHDEGELHQNIEAKPDCIGVNNRNLKTFEVDIETALQMASQIPDQFVKVAESGINSPEAILKLKKAGYQGFLMGEYFMKQSRPERACADFIHQLNQKSSKIEV